MLGIWGRILKWTAIVLGTLALLLAVAVFAGFQWLKGSLPQIDGEMTVAGIEAPVEIVRDENAVPHIYAQSVEDAYYGLGFVHAQDRLWQMHIQRQAAKGRLSEMFGGQTIEIDRYFRALNFEYWAAEALTRLSDRTKARLAAYARGVNAAMAQRPLPPEFFLLQTEPEPWSAADSVVMLKLLSVGLATNAFGEIFRARLDTVLSPGQAETFLPPYPGDAPVALPNLASLYGQTDLERHAALLRPDREWTASNNWVVSGARTVSGKPLLANDPHLELTAPSIWYLAHMSVDGKNAAGGAMPGIASVLVGRNDRIAWGSTNTGTDVQDLYVEKVNPDNKDEYLTPDGYRPFEKRVETIKVRFGTDVTETFLATRHGPVLPQNPDREPVVAPGHVLAMSWTILTEDDRTAETMNAVWEATDWQSYLDSVQAFAGPMQNLVYADAQGNIGYYSPSLVPVRGPNHETKGLKPAPGWEARNDWQGTVPYTELPLSFNPESGSIVTANHKIVPDGYPHYLTSEWAEPYRAERIEDLIANGGKHDIESFRVMLMDNVSLMAREMIPLLTAGEPEATEAKKARDMVAAWNGDMDGARPEPLIFAAWYRQLTKLIYADELGEVFERAWRQRPVFMGAVLRNEDGKGRWCDDTTTEEPETCDAQIAKALDLALSELKAAYGSDMSAWRWDAAHVSVHAHRLSPIPLIGPFFTLKAPSGGGAFTVNRGQHHIGNPRQPYAHRHGSGFRAVYDLSDLDKSIYMISTGQSGNPLSDHYGDLVDDWAEGRFITILTKREAVAEKRMGLLTLNPE